MKRILLLAATIASVPAIVWAASGQNYGAHLDGDAEVPARETLAQGQAVLKLTPSGDSISYRLIASNIENVVQAHIHVGASTEMGPVVAFLFGPVQTGGGRTDGVLATGTITADDLIGPLTGGSIDDLVEEINSGNAYVNVHTNDGVAPPDTGPGDFPGGEIRGQIEVRGQ